MHEVAYKLAPNLHLMDERFWKFPYLVKKKCYCKLNTEEHLVNRGCAFLLSTTQINLMALSTKPIHIKSIQDWYPNHIMHKM